MKYIIGFLSLLAGLTLLCYFVDTHGFISSITGITWSGLKDFFIVLGKITLVAGLFVFGFWKLDCL